LLIIAPAIYIVFAILAAFTLLLYFCFRNRIEFAAILLDNAAKLQRAYPAMTVLAFSTVLFNIIWILVWIPAGLNILLSNSGISQFYAILSFYWVQMTFQYLVLTTIGGVVGLWYYLGAENMPPNPVWRSAKRALGPSLGSIIIGAFLVALIATMRQIVQSARATKRNPILLVLAIIFLVILCLIQNYLMWFNAFVFAEIGIYGEDYITSAKNTANLLLRKLLTALLSESFVNSGLNMCVLSVAMLNAAITFGIFAGSSLAHGNLGVVFSIIAAIFGLIVGAVIMTVVVNVTFAIVVSIFVCWGEDPATLQRTNPELLQRIANTYDHINMSNYTGSFFK